MLVCGGYWCWCVEGIGAGVWRVLVLVCGGYWCWCVEGIGAGVWRVLVLVCGGIHTINGLLQIEAAESL